MALSTIAYNAHLHPCYISLQEQAYQNKGQEGYAPMTLKGRKVLEGQVVALHSDNYGNGVPCIVYPDAAGLPKDSSRHAQWTTARWAVNQRQYHLDQNGQPMDLTTVPAVRQQVLHTGCDEIGVGDLLYVRLPTNKDVEAQRCALRELYGGYGSHRQQIPPMFATYAVKRGTVDFRGRAFQYMERYKRHLTGDIDGDMDGEEGTITQIELSKIARVARVLSFVGKNMKRDGIGDEICQLAESIDYDVAGEEVSLRKCRESNVFKTSVGVQFTSTLLAILEEDVSAMYRPKPIGEVLQSLEPGVANEQRILPGHSMYVKLYPQ